MKYIDILKRHKTLSEAASGEKYKIAVISNIVVSQVKEILELALLENGVNAVITLGDYDNIVQDSAKYANYDAVIVFWESINIVDNLQDKIYLLPNDVVEQLKQRVENEIDLVTDNLKDTPLVMINSFSCKLFDFNVLQDHALKRISSHFNHYIESKIKKNQVLVDIDTVLVNVGRDAASDYRQFQSSKILYTKEFFFEYCRAIKPAIFSVTGKSKKVIVLDCDNTLWSGILGEDGEMGIELNANTRKGKAFHEVQTILRGFKKEGILLALCSKNNYEDVEHVLSHHKDMVLHDDDFVAMNVNWQDKVSSMRELSITLNLGLDSFVFVDDSDFEIGLVEKELPQVSCVRVPNNLSEYPNTIRDIKGEFFTLSQSNEDDSKTQMYRDEAERKQDAGESTSIEEYLGSLGLRLSMMWDSDTPVDRLSQLTQKTNQFNLTTRRYNENDIQRFIDEKLYRVAAFSLEDKYGEYGVTGMAIIRINDSAEKEVFIDSFLMSCRVLGRNAEYAFFDEIIKRLKKDKIETVKAEYLNTSKNKQVERLYDNLGFKSLIEEDDCRLYAINLSNYKPRDIEYIKTMNKGT